MIVTAHQPNLLPGRSVLDKLAEADAVIWLDEVQYTKGGWTNRQKLPDGTWLTVPIAHGSSFAPINRVRIGEPKGDWREPLCERLHRAWPYPVTPSICQHIRRGYPLLLGLNAAILRVLLEALGYRGEKHWQSHLDADHALVAVSDDKAQLAPISERIAKMVAALGGSTYLSGPSGFRYLDEAPFLERGIAVRYFTYAGPTNPCGIELLAPAGIAG